MARGAFNNTCDLWNGANGSAPQGSIRSSGPCRVVAEIHELPYGFPWQERVAYVTMDFDEPKAVFGHGAGSAQTLDWEEADLLAFPSGASPIWIVVWSESVAGLATPSYYRAHIALKWF